MKNKIEYPNYQNCLTNVSCSILKFFGLDCNHNSLPLLDTALKNYNYKNILMIIYDGMGSKIINKNLPDNSFFSKNIKTEISSVFPSTTAAATTSLLSALNPCEHGWVGYDVYFKKINKNVSIFSNKIKDTEIEAAEYNVVNTLLPYESIIEKINKNGHKAYSLFPFGKGHYSDLDDMLNKVKELCQKDGQKFIYAYYNEPDHTMHRNGTSGTVTSKLIKELNDKTEELVKQLNNTLIIILADHGHIDTKVINLEVDYPEFVKLIDGNTSIEGRACAFWVKKECQEEFIKQFNNLFADDFILLTKQQVLEIKLFGDGNYNDNFESSLGDFLAIGTGNRYFELHYYPDDMVTQHSGITTDEMNIPLIIIEKK